MTRKQNSQGFTLLELLVAMVIIGILASIVIVSISGGSESANIAKNKTFAQQVHALLGHEIVGEWNFDEGVSGTCPDGSDVCDYSGNNNHGTLKNGASFVSSDVEGYALSFDNIDDYVDCGSDDSLDITGEYTLEAWIYPTKLSGFYSVMGKAEGGTANTTLWLEHRQGGNIYFGGYTSEGETCYIHIDNRIVANQWQHLVGTKSSTQMKIYLNGIEIKSQDISCVPLTNNASVAIGRRGELGNYFNGLIDEVRIYSTALDISTIQNHYAQGLNKLLVNNAITEEEYDQRIVTLNQQLAVK